MNGSLNRLSDQSKDSVTRSIRNLYEVNSLNISNTILKTCLLSVCSKSDQTMLTLIPIYAGLISVLHMTVSKEIGGFLLEHLIQLIFQGLVDSNNHNNYSFYKFLNINMANTAAKDLYANINDDNSTARHQYISNKQLINYLLIILYFYNLKILHHKLIIDLLQMISHTTTNNNNNNNNNTSTTTTASDNTNMLSELELEMIICIIEHSGHLLRKDAPGEFKYIIQSIVTTNKNISHHHVNNPITSITTTTTTTTTTTDNNNDDSESRYKYFTDVLHQYSMNLTGGGNNSKSNRTINKYQEQSLSLRKWIGTMKSALIHSNNNTMSRHGQILSADTCLCVSLQDILSVETSGRWWKAGASWQKDKNNILNTPMNLSTIYNTTTTNNNNNSEYDDLSKPVNKTPVTSMKEKPVSDEEKQLLLVAKKLKFNTVTRKNIFLVIMTSMDMNDAYERLMRLDFRGKEEREIVRVIYECCAQEKIFNMFYCELLNILWYVQKI